ncbi:hypothetical protein, partial [Candidatus Ichthyocystis hellenicum]|uniref:hypothetical protein n=1 Tax=Candidatus Ichthyocystis hellenicum TaxID=1561003 RepID=UPI000B209425
NGDAASIREWENKSWNALKAIVCSLIAVKLEIGRLDDVSLYTVKGYFPEVDVEALLMSAAGKTKLSRDLVRLSAEGGFESGTISNSLVYTISGLVEKMRLKTDAAEIPVGDLAPLGIAFDSHRESEANTSLCPGLYQFFDDMEAPESTSISAISTTATTEMPVIATTESTCMSNTAIALIFMLVMSLVALVFFLLGYKCSSSKKCNLVKYIRRGGFLSGLSRTGVTNRRNQELAEGQEMVSLSAQARDVQVVMVSGVGCEDADGLESVDLS